MLGQNTWPDCLHFIHHPFLSFWMLFFISIRWRTNLSVSLWGFTSFLRMPLCFLKCQPGICTVHCQSSICILSQRPLPTEGVWWLGEQKRRKMSFLSILWLLHSSFSLAQFSQVMLSNLGWNSWSLLMSHFLERFFCIFPFKRAFPKSFTSEGDSVLC